MRYELDSLDTFITQSLRPEHLQFKPLTESDVLKGISFLRGEQDRIRLVLTTKVCSVHEDSAIQIYIRTHQHGLVYLSNLLIQYRESHTLGPEASSIQLTDVLFDETFEVLEFLLGFIEKFFSQYFDKDALIPEQYYRLISQDCTQAFDRVLKLRYIKGQRQLFLLVADVIKERVIGKHNTITYRTAFYLRELMTVITSIPKNLEMELLTINFNAPEFYEYYAHKVTLALNEDGTIQSRLRLMHYHIKQLKQLRIKPNWVYNANYPAINTWLADWLTEEVSYQEKSNQLAFVIPAAVAGETESGKYELTVSVAQLGLLTRLFMETSFSKKPVHKRVAEQMSKVFTTKKAGQHENIASESLLGRFYKHDKTTIAIVKEILIRMLNRLKDL